MPPNEANLLWSMLWLRDKKLVIREQLRFEKRHMRYSRRVPQETLEKWQAISARSDYCVECNDSGDVWSCPEGDGWPCEYCYEEPCPACVEPKLDNNSNEENE